MGVWLSAQARPRPLGKNTSKRLLDSVNVWAAAGFKGTLLRWKMKPEVVYGEKKEILQRFQAQGGQAGH
jgi:hypothetical protein